MTDNYIICSGAFMFIAIEGGDVLQLWAGMTRARNSVVERLWLVSCCQQNTFNETVFRDMYVRNMNNIERELFYQHKFTWYIFCLPEFLLNCCPTRERW